MNEIMDQKIEDDVGEGTRTTRAAQHKGGTPRG